MGNHLHTLPVGKYKREKIMKPIINKLLIAIAIALTLGIIQTIDEPFTRFNSFENYLNIGYGNVPYK